METSSAQSEAQEQQTFFLYSPAPSSSPLHSGNVFYRTTGEQSAKTLCRLFQKEYSSESEGPYFSAQSTDEIDQDDQILLDEALDWLDLYDDPDPGIYDPPPTKHMMALAQYAQRARRWESLIAAQNVSHKKNSTAKNGERLQYGASSISDQFASANEGRPKVASPAGKTLSRENINPLPSQYRFQIALSFPGEARDGVQRVAEVLSNFIAKKSILYDRWLSSELARPNLDVYLTDLYKNDSLLLVFFLCGDYARKEWCGLEWRIGRDLLKQKQEHRLMPLRLDDSEIPGFHSIDGYLDIRDLSDSEVANAILERLASLT